MIEGSRVFVTGGAGFIGSRLVEVLGPENDVTIYDSLDRSSLHARTLGPRVDVISGDILDKEALESAMAGHDVVVHCAAIAGIASVVDSPIRTLRVNTVGSFNVLEAAAGLDDVRRVVCFSTSEVFGPNANSVDEDDPAVIGSPKEPRWSYAASKVVEEHLAVGYHREVGLPTVVVRPFNVYGPGQTGEGAINTMTKRALLGERLIVTGDGSQIRAWTYVDDMVDGVLAALESPAAVGQTFNIGNATQSVTISELAQMIVDIVGSESTIEHVSALSADVYVRIPDTSRATELLGFTARVPLQEGLERTVHWLRQEAT